MTGRAALSPRGRKRAAGALLFVALLILGVGLRLRYLGDGALFIDEAESSLNALSILERGYPADTYMGLPMFENTLTSPWPESREYEFRDSSYSSRGMAIYHGWLPLYAIAASLELHGIRPDVPADPPRVLHDDAEIARRIHAVRLPSVIFGALFLAALFLAGRALYGADAGFAAMLAGALAPKCVWAAQQARYLSASLALSALAVACAWMVYRRGRWRDFLGAAAVFVLLFHTSSLAFGLLGLGCLALLPGVWRHPGAARKVAAAGAVVLLGVVPWMIWTGYFEHWGNIVLARELLDFPADYLRYLGDRPERALLAPAVVLAFALIWALRARLPARLSAPLAEAGLPVLFLCLWSLLVFAGFQALVPAASSSQSRLTCMLLAGGILLCAVGAAGAARVVFPRHSAAAAVGATLLALLGTGNAFHWQRRNLPEAQRAFQMVDYLRGLDLAPGTKLYAWPNQHFCLTFYTGLPVQSVAPVRAEFFDRHEGEIVILETVPRVPEPPPERVQALAREAGAELSEAEALALAPRLRKLMIQEEVAPLVSEFRIAGEQPGPAWAPAVVPELLAEGEAPGPADINFAHDNPAMFKGLPPLPMDEFWPAFFYRFVGAEGRRGAGLNYAARMRAAQAELLPSNWLVVRCPPRHGETQ